MTKSRIFFWLLIAFILGIAAASFIPLPIPLVWAIFVFGGVVAAFGALGAGSRRNVTVAGFAVIMLAFGLFWFWRADHPRLAKLNFGAGSANTLEGMIIDEPVRAGKNQRVVFREKTSGANILITARAYPEYRYGDVLKISGQVNRPENFSDDFDYAAYLAGQNIFHIMSFTEVELVERGRGSWFYAMLLKVKNEFSANVNYVLPEPHASFMGGLILGERRSMPAELTAELKETGTTHLVALSGYNITIIGSALYSSLVFLFIPASLAFILAIVGIILFTVAAGAAASVVRAAVMGILVLVAKREGRQYSMRNALTLAAAAMLFYNPKVLRFDIGFQLSFLATLGLVYVSPILMGYYAKLKLRLLPIFREAKLIREDRNLRQTNRNKKSFLADILISTLAAQVLVLPLLIYRFGKLSLVSPLANLAVLPFIPATMFFGFFTGGLGFAAQALARVAGFGSWILLDYELSAISFFARWPWAAFEIPWLTPGTVLVLYAIIAYWLAKNFKSGKRR